MTAILVSVAESVKDELSTLTLSEAFVPARSYADWEDKLADFDGLKVDVVPTAHAVSMQSRGYHNWRCTVSILLRKLGSQADRATSGRFDNSWIDTLINDLQTIYEFFAPSQPTYSGRRLTDVPTAKWRPESGIRHAYSAPMLKLNQYSGLVQVVYDVSKAIT